MGRTRNILLAANAAGAVQHWHMNSGKCLHSFEDEGNQVFALDYSADGSHFCTGGRDCAVRIYDEVTKAETHCMKGVITFSTFDLLRLNNDKRSLAKLLISVHDVLSTLFMYEELR